LKLSHYILLYLVILPYAVNAQMRVEGMVMRNEYKLNGPVKSVTEAHWDEGGIFLGRQNDFFSRTGKVVSETVFFGEMEDDIESLRLCNYNTDGTLSGYYYFRRGGENYSVLGQFSHWISEYDKKGHLVRKRVFEFKPKTDKYGNPVWSRTVDEVFNMPGIPCTENLNENLGNDTLYTFNKKTGRIASKHWQINELEVQGNGSATYNYTTTGDTLSIIYNDPTERMPVSVMYEYNYVSKNEKESRQNIEGQHARIDTGKAVSPVLEKRRREDEKKKKKVDSADTLRVEIKTVTTLYDSNTFAAAMVPTMIVRKEYYDDKSKMVKLSITETSYGEKRELREWRWVRKEMNATKTTHTWNNNGNTEDQIEQYQLTDMETTQWVGKELTYHVKDRFSYDRNGDPISRTRSGKSVVKPATWKFYYHEYDEFKNWTWRTYVGPATENVVTSISPQGNTIETISYDGESKEEDTRIIKYY